MPKSIFKHAYTAILWKDRPYCLPESSTAYFLCVWIATPLQGGGTRDL